MAKLIQSYRIRADRAERLKDLSFDISMKEREHIRETDLISFLIDECLDGVTMKNGSLTVDIEKLKGILENR